MFGNLAPAIAILTSSPASASSPSSGQLMYRTPSGSVDSQSSKPDWQQGLKNQKAEISSRLNRPKPTPMDPGQTAKCHERHFVVHNYHDRCNEEVFLKKSNANQHSTSNARGGVVTPFPLILHNMLERIVGVGLGHVISWNPHGRAFAVHDTKAFITNVMPRFFRQSKMSSFQRQLNLYGFARLTRSGPDKGSYYHEYFLRGRPDLCAMLHRTRVKGTGVRTCGNPESEPDFSVMIPVPFVKTGEIEVIEKRLKLLPKEGSKAKKPPSRKSLTGDFSRSLHSAPSLRALPYEVQTSPLSRPLALTNMLNSSINTMQYNDLAINPYLHSPGQETWVHTDFCVCDDRNFSQQDSMDHSVSVDSDDEIDDVEFGMLLQEVLD